MEDETFKCLKKKKLLHNCMLLKFNVMLSVEHVAP